MAEIKQVGSVAYPVENKYIKTKNGHLPAAVFILSAVLFIVSHAFNLSSQYISFYVVIEFLSIFMAFSIALTLWYTFEYSESFLKILGSSFLIISFLKMLHVLSFPGMPQFLTYNSDEKTIWFWVFSRVLGAVVLLVSGLVSYFNIQVRFSRAASFLAAGVFSVLILLLVSYHSFFHSNSWFNTNSPLINGFIILFLLLALLLFRQQQNSHYLICGIITAIFAEIALSFHSSESDAFNLLGHLYKLFSYTFIFHTLFGQTVRKPFEDLEKLLSQTVSSVSRGLGQAGSLYI